MMYRAFRAVVLVGQGKSSGYHEALHLHRHLKAVFLQVCRRWLYDYMVI